MTDRPQVAAIVLTGGLSRRMGFDKATLVVDGRRMVDRTIDVLSNAGVERVVLAGPDIENLAIGVASQPDPGESGAGPLAGIVSAWQSLRQDRIPYGPVVVLACDLPNLQAGTVEALLRASAATEHGAVAHDGERPQPLVAAYSRAALDDLCLAYEAGETSVRRCFARWELATVNSDPQVVADADRPADLADHEVSWPDEPDRSGRG